MERILITDVTQMREERLCVAGLNMKLEGVRLDVAYPGIYKYLLYQNGNVIIRPRAVIDVQIKPDEKRETPHIEDFDWLAPENTRFEYLADDGKWCQVLSRTAKTAVQEIFEAPLIDNRKIAHKQGKRSLGTLTLSKPPEFHYMEDKDYPGGYRSRLSFYDGADEKFYRLPIVELTTLYHTNFLRERKHLSVQKIENLVNEALQGKAVFLRLGLTRALRDREGLCHYLQVTGIFTFPDFREGKCFADFDC